MARYAYHVAPADEDTRRSIRRFGLLPSLPATSDRWESEPVRDQRRGVYAVTGRPPKAALHPHMDIYRIELPRGLRTYRDHMRWGPYSGSCVVIPRRVPPTWIALVARGFWHAPRGGVFAAYREVWAKSGPHHPTETRGYAAT